MNLIVNCSRPSKPESKGELGGNPALLEFVGPSLQMQPSGEGPGFGGADGRVRGGPPAPRGQRAGPADPRGPGPHVRLREGAQNFTWRGGRVWEPGARSTASRSRSPRAQLPTCQGKERSERAARKRRSKFRSRLAASAVSSGAMAGRGLGVARETGPYAEARGGAWGGHALRRRA